MNALALCLRFAASRRIIGLGLAAFLLSVFYTSPLHAQDSGSRIDPYRGAVGAIESEDSKAARRVMTTFGRCVARNRSSIAREVLALPLYSREQGDLARRAVRDQDGCLGAGDRQLRFSPRLLVGAMAEWFIISRHDNSDLTAISGLTDERQTEIGLAPRTGYEDLAICVVRRDPAAVRALVAAPPASEAEGEVMARLVPHLSPCLPSGQEFSFNHGALRSLLAAGFHRVLTIVENGR